MAAAISCMRGLPAGLARIHLIQMPPTMIATTAQTSAKIRPVVMACYSLCNVMCSGPSGLHKSPHLTVRGARLVKHGGAHRSPRKRRPIFIQDDETTLFCQFAVEKVEPVLSPEEF